MPCCGIGKALDETLLGNSGPATQLKGCWSPLGEPRPLVSGDGKWAPESGCSLADRVSVPQSVMPTIRNGKVPISDVPSQS